METMERTISEIDQDRVRRKFNRACSTYDESAVAQQQIARHLSAVWEMYQRKHGFQPTTALEIGCGTGGFSRYLQSSCASAVWTLNDLYPACAEKALRFCAANTHFVCADATAYPWIGPFELIASSSVFQWFPAPGPFVQRLASCQKSGHVLLFSTFLPGNLGEIRELTGQGLVYPSAWQWRDWLSSLYDMEHIEESEIRLLFSSPKAVLRHLKETGVTGNHAEFWTPGRLRAFSAAYQERFGTVNQQVTLTYRPLYVLAVRK